MFDIFLGTPFGISLLKKTFGSRAANFGLVSVGLIPLLSWFGVDRLSCMHCHSRTSCLIIRPRSKRGLPLFLVDQLPNRREFPPQLQTVFLVEFNSRLLKNERKRTWLHFANTWAILVGANATNDNISCTLFQRLTWGRRDSLLLQKR